MKKLFKIAIVILLVPLVLVVVSLFLVWNFMCSDTYSPAKFSPNGWYKAQVNTTNCGATTKFQTDLTITKPILGVINPKISQDGYVFGFHGASNDLDISWLDNQTLKVTYKYCDVYRQLDSWDGIKITYDKQCEDKFY